MKFFVPYNPRLEKYLLKDQDISFYNAIEGYPELCGGRRRHVTEGKLIPPDRLERLSSTLGDRFYLTANSTFPKLTDGNKWIFKLLDHYNSGIVVAREEFAKALKDFIPTLRVHASCIMNFYTPLKKILESDLFEMVCPPQFENYFIDKMAELIPEEHRERCYYIVNSECRWTSYCKLHYEDMSLSYEGKQSEEYLLVQESHKEPLLKNESEEQEALRALSRTESLAKRGFTTFKIQGRDRRPLLNLFILNIIRRQRGFSRVDNLLNWAESNPKDLATIISEVS